MLLALHKPFGVLSQFTSAPGSRWRTLADYRLPPDTYALGRLDADSEGLLLLSDEPGLNSRLLDPRSAHPREYWVQVERIPTDAALGRLARGVRIGGYSTRPCLVRRLEPAGGAFPPWRALWEVADSLCPVPAPYALPAEKVMAYGAAIASAFYG